MQLINVIPRLRKEVPVRRSAEYNRPALWSEEFESPFLEMERMFERLFHLSPDSPNREALTGFSPSLDLHETEKEFQINVEVPGMTANDIDISVTNNVLTISGEKKEEKEENSKGIYRLERRYGSFSRAIPLPQNCVDIEQTEASYKGGVLTIKLPKATDYKENVKKIPVSVNKSESENKAPEGKATK
jgi:HSP20 family protein